MKKLTCCLAVFLAVISMRPASASGLVALRRLAGAENAYLKIKGDSAPAIRARFAEFAKITVALKDLDRDTGAIKYLDQLSGMLGKRYRRIKGFSGCRVTGVFYLLARQGHEPAMAVGAAGPVVCPNRGHWALSKTAVLDMGPDLDVPASMVPWFDRNVPVVPPPPSGGGLPPIPAGMVEVLQALQSVGPIADALKTAREARRAQDSAGSKKETQPAPFCLTVKRTGDAARYFVLDHGRVRMLVSLTLRKCKETAEDKKKKKRRYRLVPSPKGPPPPPVILPPWIFQDDDDEARKTPRRIMSLPKQWRAMSLDKAFKVVYYAPAVNTDADRNNADKTKVSRR
jgi:hypothetical protein